MPYPQITDGYLEYGTSGFPLVGGGAENVLDDFEDQSLDEYGDTTGWQIQGTNVLQGRYSLESTAENVDIGDHGADLPTPREDPPIEYRCRMIQSDPGRSALLVNVQSKTYPSQHAYSVVVDTANNQIGVTRTEDGASYPLDSVSGSRHPEPGTQYIPAITTSSEAVKASLYSRSGDLLLETDAIRDTTYSGGGLGWYNLEGPAAYFDYATRNPGTIEDIQEIRRWIEDFEDGDLTEYTFINESGQTNISPSASYRGNYGLELTDGVEIQSTPGSGLSNYPRSGEPIVFRVNFQTLQSSSGAYQQYWVPFCMQNSGSDVNRYRLEFLMNGGFRIRKTDSNGTSTVPGTSSEGRDYAALYNVSHSTGSWYSAILLPDQTNGLYAELHDAGNNIKGWISSPEAEFVGSENGVGFRSSGSGHVFFDHMFEVDQQYFDDTGRTEPIPHPDAPW